MADLVEFLLARIAEDERAAHDVRPGPRIVRTNAPDVERYLTVWHPDRALAECDAKRRIIDARRALTGQETAPTDRAQGWYLGMTTAYDRALRLLALPYEDHPDYRAEWGS